MRTSQEGIDLLKRFEGLRLDAYRDIAGVLTIGYGHTAGFRDGRFDENSVITPEVAQDLLEADLIAREERVAALVNVPLCQHEFDGAGQF